MNTVVQHVRREFELSNRFCLLMWVATFALQSTLFVNVVAGMFDWTWVTPSLSLEVVDKEKFDHYDGQPYNKDPNNTNEEMLSSELEWLDERLEKVFAGQFKQDDDYTIPFNWPGARSRTIVLYSDKAVSAFPKLVLAMQKVLAEAKEDWILYFQTDGPETEFIVWIYPDKVVTTEEYAEAIRKLIK